MYLNVKFWSSLGHATNLKQFVIARTFMIRSQKSSLFGSIF